VVYRLLDPSDTGLRVKMPRALLALGPGLKVSVESPERVNLGEASQDYVRSRLRPHRRLGAQLGIFHDGVHRRPGVAR
jgi:hypothetical protein